MNDAQQVADYLQEHPKFFHDYLTLLENMSIPHPSGDAVSLISKQLELFRNRHQEQENQLTALIEIAKENDLCFNRMHELTLALLEANTLEEVVINLKSVFADCFLTDFVAIRIVRDQMESSMSNLFVHSNDEGLRLFTKELSTNQSTCGRLTLPQARFLFGHILASEVKSCAIIPMSFTQLEGILAIGSRDEKRFHYNMGHLFLTQMSKIIGTRLISILG